MEKLKKEISSSLLPLLTYAFQLNRKIILAQFPFSKSHLSMKIN